MTVISFLSQITSWKKQIKMLSITAVCFLMFSGLNASAQDRQMEQLAKELARVAENVDPNNIDGFFQKIKSIIARMSNLIVNQPDSDADTKELGRLVNSMLNTNDPMTITDNLDRIMQLADGFDQKNTSSRQSQDLAQRKQLTKNDDPDDMTTLRGQSNHFDDWAKEDQKKYPGQEKGYWKFAMVAVTSWGMKGKPKDADFIGIDATVVNDKNVPSSLGCCMEIYNYTKFPIYFGIGGGLRDKLEPGVKRIVDLPVIYLPVDPSKRLREPPRREEVLIRYWSRTP